MKYLFPLAALATFVCLGQQQIKTGPAVGEKIPPFEVVDQDGRKQTLESLRGPNGLVLMFVRSADW